MADRELIEFIKEARRRGFSDIEIRQPLLANGWLDIEIDEAFSAVSHAKNKNKVCFYVSDNVLRAIEKRAKKNMLSVEQQIEDIVRRSCINSRKTKTVSGDTDDKLVSIFSRKKQGMKKRKKKVKVRKKQLSEKKNLMP